MAVSVLLSGLGMGEYFYLVGAILAVDPILDMGRTMLNVNGTMTTAVTVANSVDQLDKNVFDNKTYNKSTVYGIYYAPYNYFNTYK